MIWQHWMLNECEQPIWQLWDAQCWLQSSWKIKFSIQLFAALCSSLLSSLPHGPLLPLSLLSSLLPFTTFASAPPFYSFFAPCFPLHITSSLLLSSLLFHFELSSPRSALKFSPTLPLYSPPCILLSSPSPVLLSLLPPPLICSPGSDPVKLPVLQSDGDRVQNLITHWLTARTTC